MLIKIDEEKYEKEVKEFLEKINDTEVSIYYSSIGPFIDVESEFRLNEFGTLLMQDDYHPEYFNEYVKEYRNMMDEYDSWLDYERLDELLRDAINKVNNFMNV